VAYSLRYLIASLNNRPPLKNLKLKIRIDFFQNTDVIRLAVYDEGLGRKRQETGMCVLPTGRCRGYTESTKLHTYIGAISRRCAPGGSARHSHEHGKATCNTLSGNSVFREIFYEELK
jgi:hypothetical protein